MSYTPEQIAKIKSEKPNLWRVACELATFKDPYKVIDILLPMVGPMLKQEQEGALCPLLRKERITPHDTNGQPSR